MKNTNMSTLYIYFFSHTILTTKSFKEYYPLFFFIKFFLNKVLIRYYIIIIQGEYYKIWKFILLWKLTDDHKLNIVVNSLILTINKGEIYYKMNNFGKTDQKGQKTLNIVKLTPRF